MSDVVVGLRPAAEIAGVTDVAVLDWCRRLDIGELKGGRWHIDRRKLRRIIAARRVLGMDRAA